MSKDPPLRRTPSGLFEAVVDGPAAQVISALRPREAPSLGPPPPPSSERLVARIAAGLAALSGPTHPGLEATCAVVSRVLEELLPERSVRVVPVRAGDGGAAGDGHHDNASEYFLPDALHPVVRVQLAPHDADALDERALAQDEAVLQVAAPFLGYALRSAATIDHLRDQIRQGDRLSTIGRYSAELLHELATPLSAIGMHAAFLRRTSHEAGVLERASRIDEAATRMTELSTRVLRFARSSTVEPPVRLSIAEVVDEALALCGPAIDHANVALERRLDGDVPDIEGRRSELIQVFVNLVVNAVQAVTPGQGRVYVAVLRASDGGAEVRVEDDGHGISPAHLSRVFEPFFSTKGAGLGTGLGLSIVRAIVEAHHARVLVDSAPGRGTRFTVRIPPAPVTEP